MDRFAYVCKYLHICKYTHLSKSAHVNGFAHICKICTIIQSLEICTWSQPGANFNLHIRTFAYMQICPCERKSKFAYMSIGSFVPY